MKSPRRKSARVPRSARRSRAAKRKPLAFQRLQYRFAAHLRDPARNRAPAGVEARRMKIYAELFYNNLQGFLATAFPVLRRITPDVRWHAMVRDFFARHESHEPLFHRIAEEFLRYLDAGRRGRIARDDPSFLRELAHYEWVELALSVSPVDLHAVRANADGDLLDGVPVVSPLAWSLSYKFPVQRIGPDFQPTAPPPQPTHVVVYRTCEDDVKFMEANAVTARLLDLARKRPATGRALLMRIARELRHPDPAAVVAQGAAILRELRDRDVILGTRR
jgi:uncharacterized protein